ncbi:MAG: HD domain-containing protein [Planctomycetes bacterium]|nr:HD domain-containing protein [Planctomycetota bacterium]
MSNSDHIAIKDFRPNAQISGVYGLVNPQIGTTRAGKSFFKALIRDASGEAALRVWVFDESRLGETIRTGFVHLSGQTQNYNGHIQVIADTIRAEEVSTDQLKKLLPATTRDIEHMMKEVERLLHSMQHPGMRALAEQYLANDHITQHFRRAPAAVSVHHAYIGGLLEHTLQLMLLAEVMLPLYPALNRDLVLMGLFLHDLGKTVELEWERGFAYTADGNLVGHVVRGAIWLQTMAAAASKKAPLPPEALRVLLHTIISHHGALEHGAAKLPSTPEAMFVAMLDNLDAKTTATLVAAARDRADAYEPGHEFSDKIWSLDVRVYRPDPLIPAPAPKSAEPAQEE